MKTIIWYTDAITALVRSLEPLRDAIEDAEGRGETELRDLLWEVYGPAHRKLVVCVREGWRDEEWTASELGADDTQRLTRLLAPAKNRRAA